MAHNHTRADRFKRLSINELQKIAEGGSLAAAAAAFEMRRRNNDLERKTK